ncbi:MAG: YicC family protein [Clostridiales bacterium]|jgi:uncharacterized protein (TIGR00255 family)|nr:YicC family protein [Clostridiales bacterium]
MKSMTGYGKSVINEDGRTLTVEIKSVNHRFLDIALKNFKTFGFAEEAVKKLVEGTAARGHIDVYINYTDGRQNAVKAEIDYNLAAEYLESAKKAEELLGIKNDLTFSSLIAGGDVFKTVFQEDDAELLAGLITKGVESALFELDAARCREGASIKADLKEKLKAVRERVAEIERRSPAVYSEYKEKLTARIRESLADVQIDEARLINEVAFFTDRAGIDEENERLKIHIASFFDVIDAKTASGRKMDFMLQEMNREINTVGSKSNDIELSEHVIFVKTELEKIREQVQNIE